MIQQNFSQVGTRISALCRRQEEPPRVFILWSGATFIGVYSVRDIADKQKAILDEKGVDCDITTRTLDEVSYG